MYSVISVLAQARMSSRRGRSLADSGTMISGSAGSSGSAGCSACHFQTGVIGRSGSKDPNVLDLATVDRVGRIALASHPLTDPDQQTMAATIVRLRRRAAAIA